MSLKISSSSGLSGSVFSLYATVSSSGAPVTAGTVTFTDTFGQASQVLGTIPVQSSGGTPGLALLKTQLGGAGSHTITAMFNATSALTSSFSTTSVLLTPESTVSATPTGTTGRYLLTGTVSAFNPSVIPTGTVSFADTTAGTTLLADQALDPSTALIPTPANIYPVASKLYSISNLQSAAGVSMSMATPAFGDFNGDGKLDIVVPNGGSVYAKGGQILLGNGDGTFSPGVSLSSLQPSAAVVGDFNRDGFQDVAIVNSGSIGSVDIYLGKGDGTFKPMQKYAMSSFQANYVFIAVGDFDNNGIQDLVITDQYKGVAVLLGNGDGTFSYPSSATSPTFIFTGSTVGNLAVGDVNGDGNQDLVASELGKGQVAILLGDGKGEFTPGASPTFPGRQSGTVALGKFNSVSGEKGLDLVVSDQIGQAVYLFSNNGAGTFTLESTIPMSNYPYFVMAGDFDHDGNLDILVTSDVDANGVYMEILRGHGDGTFDPPTFYQTGGISIYAIVGDINGDGLADVVTSVTGLPGSSTPPVGLALTLSMTSIATQPASATVYGCGSQMVNAIYNSDGNYPTSTGPDIALTPSTIATSINLAATPVSGTYGQQITLNAVLSPSQYGSVGTDGEIVTFMNGTTALQTAPLKGGVATVSVTSLPVGTNSLTVVYPGDCTFTGSSSSAVNVTVAAPPPAFDFNFQITSSTTVTGVYGSSGQFTFLLSPLTGTTLYPGSVQISVNGTNGPLLATYALSPTSVAANGGPTTINLTVSTRTLAQLDMFPRFIGAAPVAFALLLLPVCSTKRFRHSSRLLAGWTAMVLVLVGLASLTGCGSGYFDHLYPIVVTATSNGVQHSITVDYHILKSSQ